MPQKPITILNTAPPPLFNVKIIALTPPGFEDPNHWGCIIVTGYKPTATDTEKAVFPLGKKCPPNWPDSSGAGIDSPGAALNWAIDHVPELGTGWPANTTS